MAWLDRVAGVAAGRAGVVIVAAWSFAEAIALPIVPDIVLDLFGLAAPRRTARLFLVSVLGSLAGTVVLFAVATALPHVAESLVLAVPFIDQPMLDAARITVSRGDPVSMALFGPGTPLKVFTVAWTLGPGSLGGLLVGAVLNRCTRILPALLVATGLGALAPAWLRRHDRLVCVLYAAAWLAVYVSYAM